MVDENIFESKEVKKKEEIKDGLDVVTEDPKIIELKSELKKIKEEKEAQHKTNLELQNQLTMKLETLKDPEQYVPKKVAALEVYKEVINFKNGLIYSIITAFLIAGTSAYFVFIGAIVAGIVSMGFAVMIMKKNKMMKYLEERYDLIRPKLFRKVE